MQFRPFSSPKSFIEKYDHLVCFWKKGRAVLQKPSTWVARLLQSFHLRSGFYLNCKAQGILQDHRKLFWESTLKSCCWKSREPYFRPEHRLSNRERRQERNCNPALSALASDSPSSLGVFSSLMGNFIAPTSLALLTGLFPKQLLIYKGYNILYRVFWCGTQQSLLLAGCLLASGRKTPQIWPGGVPAGSAHPSAHPSSELHNRQLPYFHRCLTVCSPTPCFHNGTNLDFLIFFFNFIWGLFACPCN